jgi:transglutaminase-like domain
MISILIMCAMLTGCGQANMSEIKTDIPTVSPTEVTSETVDKAESAKEKSKGIGEISCEVTTTCSDMTSPTSQPAEIAAGSADEPIAAEIQETEVVSYNTKEEKKLVFSEESAESQTTAHQPTTPCTTEKAVTTTTYAAQEKPKSVQTTAKIPETQPKTESQTTVTVSENAKEKEAAESVTTAVQAEAEVEEIPDISQKTDYEKALEVYNFMRENGSGTCVNYACQTYEMCQEVGLTCYIVWTENQLCGHVANTVCVNGTWFILDAQGGYFLEYNYGFTEVVDINENHIADSSLISSYSYEELYG